jgi:hypothetical protein
MDLRVSLAQFETQWRFVDSGRLEAWLASRPWVDGGGVRLLRASGPAQATLLTEALPERVHAVDQGRTNVDTLLVRSFDAVGDVRALAKLVFDIQPSSTRRALELAADVLSHQRTLLVLEGTRLPEEAVRAFIEAATQLASDVAKLRPSVALPVLVIHSPGLPCAEGGWSFTSGGPLGEVLGRSDAQPSARWAAYVHMRLAWESAGELDVALEWAAPAAGLTSGADGGLEQVLNALADEAWQRLDGSRRELLHGYLAMLGKRPWDRMEYIRRTEELQAAQLAWRPSGVAHVRPVPWAARALARQDRRPAHTQTLLRSCMTCAPIAKEVVSRCLDLEAYLRARHAPEPVPRPFGKADEALRDFQGRGNESFDRRFYPEDCPAAALVDASAFMPFGEFLEGLPLHGWRRKALHQLRQLRNSVAHGHYVGWESLRMLEELEAQLTS